MKKRFKVEFVNVATPEQSAAIVKNLVRDEMMKVYRKHGVIATNLDEVLYKHINAEPADEQ
ncbi:hypothetical protein [Paenibacillus sp. HW567]|uniref:hypothetical protein n=1 Tax=Paenibacillus sp. HW567 TaxID=1034769 RepID=UPI0003736888|nr:hypothetical protein [Paenibacillus sp. HW567]